MGVVSYHPLLTIPKLEGRKAQTIRDRDRTVIGNFYYQPALNRLKEALGLSDVLYTRRQNNDETLFNCDGLDVLACGIGHSARAKACDTTIRADDSSRHKHG
jgi:hypothetical protein